MLIGHADVSLWGAFNIVGDQPCTHTYTFTLRERERERAHSERERESVNEGKLSEDVKVLEWLCHHHLVIYFLNRMNKTPKQWDWFRRKSVLVTIGCYQQVQPTCCSCAWSPRFTPLSISWVMVHAFIMLMEMKPYIIYIFPFP